MALWYWHKKVGPLNAVITSIVRSPAMYELLHVLSFPPKDSLCGITGTGLKPNILPQSFCHPANSVGALGGT